MKSNDSVILVKSKDFALHIIDLYKHLCYEEKEFTSIIKTTKTNNYR